MKVMIHACPKRLWYVDRYLAPSLREQGLEPIVWNDAEGYGCLASCLRSFRSGQCEWHIQDDVLIARNFAELARKYDSGVVAGFCHAQSGDDSGCVGRVYAPDLWHGFPCVRIPIDYALAYCDWVDGSDHDEREWYAIKTNKGDDYLFHSWFQKFHGREMVINAVLVEHVDFMLGGSVVNQWRGYAARNDLWTDAALVDELRQRLTTEPIPLR